MNLCEVMQKLYDSEINCCVSTFWDGGYRVRIGDEMNGYRSDDNVDTQEKAAKALDEAAHLHFPNSTYVLGKVPGPIRIK